MKKLNYTQVFLLLITFLGSLNNLHSQNYKVTEKEFNHGIQVLREHVLLLEVHYEIAVGEKEISVKIKSYDDMMSFIKKNKPGKFFLFQEKEEKLFEVCEMSPEDIKSKGLGQWFWKRVCEAAELGGIMKDCNGFFEWK